MRDAAVTDLGRKPGAALGGRLAGPAPARLAVVWVLAVGLAACGPSPSAEDSTAAQPAAASASAPPAAGQGIEGLSRGSLVWESDRSGAWRIWTRRLEGGPPRQLTPDEPRRAHCCPHVAPDGSGLVYLSLEPGESGYAEGGGLGVLRWIGLDGGGDRALAPAARTYYEHRAAVWRGMRELIFISGDRSTALLDLANGKVRRLGAWPGGERGALIDPTLRWAATGTRGFYGYDAESGSMVERTPFGGCQFYFSQDGRFGYWMAGPGGPIQRLDFASGEVATIVRKSDPSLPDGLGYLYFPMLSADRRMLAFGASRDEHPHESDYEIFVLEVDPDTLLPIGDPVRYTGHPASDRFPDLWVEPLGLGRQAGEVPFAARFAPDGADAAWRWDLGDGALAEGAVVEHIYRSPGRYPVQAEGGGRRLDGLVVVRAASPPRPLSATLRDGGRSLQVDFDEPIDLGGAEIELASGTAIAGRSLSDDGRAVVLELAAPLAGPDTLRLASIADRASPPNRLESAELAVAPPLWPANEAGLQFRWETGDAANLIFDPESGVSRASVVEAAGRARFDHDFAMRPAGGRFEAAGEAGNRIRWACQATYELSIEAVVDPGAGGDVALVDLARGGRRNFVLFQKGGWLRFAIVTEGSELREVQIGRLVPGRKSHVAVTYSAGRLAAYVDGERVLATDEVQGGFFRWRSLDLTFGDGGPWDGSVEGVAIYNRELTADEVRENARRYRAALELRPEVPRTVVVARRESCEAAPSLADISPYREALAVCRFRVERVEAGDAAPGDRLLAARWALLDGEEIAPPPAGPARLVLEPFAAQPQLASVYLAGERPGDGELLFVAEWP